MLLSFRYSWIIVFFISHMTSVIFAAAQGDDNVVIEMSHQRGGSVEQGSTSGAATRVAEVDLDSSHEVIEPFSPSGSTSESQSKSCCCCYNLNYHPLHVATAIPVGLVTGISTGLILELGIKLLEMNYDCFAGADPSDWHAEDDCYFKYFGGRYSIEDQSYARATLWLGLAQTGRVVASLGAAAGGFFAQVKAAACCFNDSCRERTRNLFRRCKKKE